MAKLYAHAHEDLPSAVELVPDCRPSVTRSFGGRWPRSLRIAFGRRATWDGRRWRPSRDGAWTSPSTAWRSAMPRRSIPTALRSRAGTRGGGRATVDVERGRRDGAGGYPRPPWRVVAAAASGRSRWLRRRRRRQDGEAGAADEGAVRGPDARGRPAVPDREREDRGASGAGQGSRGRASTPAPSSGACGPRSTSRSTRCAVFRLPMTSKTSSPHGRAAARAAARPGRRRRRGRLLEHVRVPRRARAAPGGRGQARRARAGLQGARLPAPGHADRVAQTTAASRGGHGTGPRLHAR